MLKTESNMKKQGCHQNRQWWEYEPQVLTPPDQTMGIFGTHSYLKGNSDRIPCFSQETPGVCDTLATPKVEVNIIGKCSKNLKKNIYSSQETPGVCDTLVESKVEVNLNGKCSRNLRKNVCSSQKDPRRM